MHFLWGQFIYRRYIVSFKHWKNRFSRWKSIGNETFVRKALTDKGFKVSTVEVYNDGSHTANTVKESYASAPAAGSTAAVGEEIVLQVYGEVQTTSAVEPENEIGTD